MHLKIFSLDEEAYKSLTVITVDSPDRVVDAQPALEDVPQDASKEAYLPLKDGILARGSPGAEGVVVEAPIEVIAAPSFSTKLASVGPRRPRMANRLLLSTYFPSQEWIHPSANTVALGLKGTQEIIDLWSPFNKRESSVAHMRGLYPTLLRVPTAACAE